MFFTPERIYFPICAHLFKENSVIIKQMYHPNFSREELEKMFEDYKRVNVVATFFYLIATFGFYIIPWIFFHNRKFEQIDEQAPDSRRGAVILFILPILSYTTFLAMEKIFFPNSFPLTIIKVLVWCLLIFLTLKYLYEFSRSFAKITLTNTLAWYIFIYIGYSSYILALFGFYYALYAVIIFFIGIASMQEILNVVCFRVTSKKQKESFNYMPKEDNNF